MNIEYLLKEAYKEAAKSIDPSTQNGALLIDHNGNIFARDCNRLPSGVKNTPDRLERAKKYRCIGHAEANVICKVARKPAGTTNNKIIICPWVICAPCATLAIQAGIKRIIGHQDAVDRLHGGEHISWRDDVELGMEMLSEAGVEVQLHKGNLGLDFPLRFDYKEWYP